MTLDQIADQKTNLSGSLRSKKSFLLAKPPLSPLSSKDPRFCSATFLSFDEVGTVASSFTCDFQPKAIIVTPNALHHVVLRYFTMVITRYYSLNSPVPWGTGLLVVT